MVITVGFLLVVWGDTVVRAETILVVRLELFVGLDTVVRVETVVDTLSEGVRGSL